MEFDFLDRYLLDGTPSKGRVVRELLERRFEAPGAAPFYQGMEMLGEKTPDLTLMALRLVFAGKAADDAAVIRMRQIVERARANGIDRQSAVEKYYGELS